MCNPRGHRWGGGGLHMGVGMVHPWRCCQFIAGPNESFCGIGTLLNGTIVITSISLVWYCLISQSSDFLAKFAHLPLVISLFIHQEWVVVFQTCLIILLKVWLKGCDENGIFQSGANVLPFTTRWQHRHGATGFTHNKHKKAEKHGRMKRKQYFMLQNFPWHSLDFINADQIEKDAKKNHNISRRWCHTWLP